MLTESFVRSDAFTMGVELELQLIDLATYDLTPSGGSMLDMLSKTNVANYVVPEITESMLEINTGIHTNYINLLEQLGEIRSQLVTAATYLRIGVCGGGTHPFQRWNDRRIVARPRFRALSELYGYLAKQFTVFGQHIHIGCTSGDEALYLMHALNRFVPHFVALAASSPYVQGEDTHFASARLNSIDAFPFSGYAPFVLKWDAFENETIFKMKKTGMINHIKDLYWDIRPKPEFGTIELRICDTPLTIEKAAVIACYLQVLCCYLLQRTEPAPEADDYLVYAYNRFQASRFGMHGVLIHPKTHASVLLSDDIYATVNAILPYAPAFHAQAGMAKLVEMLEQSSDADYLRDHYARYGGKQAVVRAALRQFSA